MTRAATGHLLIMVEEALIAERHRRAQTDPTKPGPSLSREYTLTHCLSSISLLILVTITINRSTSTVRSSIRLELPQRSKNRLELTLVRASPLMVIQRLLSIEIHRLLVT